MERNEFLSPKISDEAIEIKYAYLPTKVEGSWIWFKEYTVIYRYETRWITQYRTDILFSTEYSWDEPVLGWHIIKKNFKNLVNDSKRIKRKT